MKQLLWFENLCWQYTDNFIVKNNIIYDFPAWGIYIDNDIWADTLEYYYNNTIYGEDGNGIYISRENATLINNVVQTSGTDYEPDVYSSMTANNISSDGTAPGTNSQTTTTVSFIDETNDDFHLSPSDTAAKDAGVALWNPGSGSGAGFASTTFSTDIDGTSRGNAWDIGADEVPMEFVSTVCQDSTTGGDCDELDYKSLGGTDNWEDRVETDLTASTTRVFSGSITGNLAEDASVTLVFPSYATTTITGTVVATTSDQILIDNITGSSTPVTVASGSQWWVDGNNYWTVTGATTSDDLGASPIAIAKIDGAWSASDTVPFSIGGWTTDNDNYIKIYTTSEARHDGKWNYNKYRLGIDGYYVIYNYADYLHLDGVQIKLTATGGVNPIAVYTCPADSEKSSNIRISNNIITADLTGLTNTGDAIDAHSYGNGGMVHDGKIWNNIFYGWKGGSGGSDEVMRLSFSGQDWEVYNNTIYDSERGINGNVGVIAINNLIASNLI